MNPKVNLPVTVLKEGKSYVAYGPALDLSTSAKTYHKVQSCFGEAVEVFFGELTRMVTLDKVLVNLGWRRIKSNWEPSTVISNYVQSMDLCYV